MQVIPFTTNPFGGIVVDPKALPEDPETFKEQLHQSLGAWRSAGYLVAWLEVPIARARLIPVAVEAGFGFHHSSESYLMLTCRLKENAFIPPFASHYIGAGGVVLNEKRELLVVCERHRAPGRPPFYKLPGGALHPGEHLVEGVIREVYEETGVKTQFESLVCFRHWHGYRHGKSDIYFVCRLSPLSQEISMQVEEIEECLWMPVDLYLQDQATSPFNRRIVRAALESPGIKPGWVEGYTDHRRYEFFLPDGTG